MVDAPMTEAARSTGPATGAYRSSPEVALAALPRPSRPNLWMAVGPTLVDLHAPERLPARFESLGARLEESWESGAIATMAGVVVAATVIGFADRTPFGDAYPRARGMLRASVAPGLSGFAVSSRRRPGLGGWAARLGLLPECAVSEPSMRERFVVRGHEPTAQRLLGPDVCAALVALERILTRLAVNGGTVEVRWRAPSFSDDTVLPAEAVAIAVAIARASVA